MSNFPVSSLHLYKFLSKNYNEFKTTSQGKIHSHFLATLAHMMCDDYDDTVFSFSIKKVPLKFIFQNRLVSNTCCSILLHRAGKTQFSVQVINQCISTVMIHENDMIILVLDKYFTP